MPSAEPGKKLPLVKLAIAAAILVGIAALLLLGFDVRGWISRLVDSGMAMIRGAGPAAFFAAMVLLPAVGMPMLAFTLTAGDAFAGQLGMPLVIGLTVLGVTLNLVLTYALARWLLRPVLKRLMALFGYSVPQVPPGGVTDFIVILRVTPGIPFFVQNYLLGLAEVPFGPFLVISILASWSYSIAFVVFGQALLQGRGRTFMYALGALVALTFITRAVRKHFRPKEAPPP